MSKLVECPQCLGTGQVVIKGRAKTCNLCNGEGHVPVALEQSFIDSLKWDN